MHSLLRWLHIYTSMVSLLVVLFFAATGVTLNHPDWLAGERTEELSGTLPATWKTAKGIDWLVVAEHLRAAHGVHGTVADRREDDREGSLTFRAPGYSADAFIDVRDGSYKLTVSYQGAVGVLNDLHRGRDAGERVGVADRRRRRVPRLPLAHRARTALLPEEGAHQGAARDGRRGSGRDRACEDGELINGNHE